jgi:curved DNA-binding protein CbpA
MTMTAASSIPHSEIRRAYATLVRHYHPDTSPDTASVAGLQAVQQLYREITRPSSRTGEHPYAAVDARPRVIDTYA